MTHPDCLRPEFTCRLAGRFTEGACINLISPHGQGRRRTLEDLRNLLGESVRVVQANLRDCLHSASLLQAGLCRQAGCNDTSLDALAEHLARSSEKWLIILHNFDELQTGEESGFDNHFFKTLNSVATTANIALLCVSESAVHGLPLHLEAIDLPPVTETQLLNEIGRRHLQVASTEATPMAAWLLKQRAPYTLLDEASGELLADRPWREG